MDRITQNLLEEFLADQEILSVAIDKDFEKFCNYIVVASEFSGHFEVLDTTTENGNDTGIDGIAIIVNGSLVTSIEEIEALVKLNGYLEATFVFVQAKTSSSFDATDLNNFYFGVRDFFSDSPKLPRNSIVQEKVELANFVFENSGKMKGGKTPTCKLYYVATGRWNDNDQNLRARIDQGNDDLRSTNLFSGVHCVPVDAERIQRMYYATKAKVSKTINFERRVTLPPIEGVDQAYTGILSASDYLTLITDDHNNIQKTLFTDNIRDFLGDNPVNKEIAETLRDPSAADKFVVLNNGITIVAESVSLTGDKFTLDCCA